MSFLTPSHYLALNSYIKLILFIQWFEFKLNVHLHIHFVQTLWKHVAAAANYFWVNIQEEPLLKFTDPYCSWSTLFNGLTAHCPINESSSHGKSWVVSFFFSFSLFFNSIQKYSSDPICQVNNRFSICSSKRCATAGSYHMYSYSISEWFFRNVYVYKKYIHYLLWSPVKWRRGI